MDLTGPEKLPCRLLCIVLTRWWQCRTHLPSRMSIPACHTGQSRRQSAPHCIQFRDAAWVGFRTGTQGSAPPIGARGIFHRRTQHKRCVYRALGRIAMAGSKSSIDWISRPSSIELKEKEADRIQPGSPTRQVSDRRASGKKEVWIPMSKTNLALGDAVDWVPKSGKPKHACS